MVATRNDLVELLEFYLLVDVFSHALVECDSHRTRKPVSTYLDLSEARDLFPMFTPSQIAELYDIPIGLRERMNRNRKEPRQFEQLSLRRPTTYSELLELRRNNCTMASCERKFHASPVVQESIHLDPSEWLLVTKHDIPVVNAGCHWSSVLRFLKQPGARDHKAMHNSVGLNLSRAQALSLNGRPLRLRLPSCPKCGDPTKLVNGKHWQGCRRSAVAN